MKTLLVIPHYRDAHRLRPFLGDLSRRLPPTVSVMVSDDGSGEEGYSRLLEVVSEARATADPGGPAILAPLAALQNRGKGAAVYAGWRAGIERGFGALAFADADGSVCATEIARAIRHFEDHRNDLDLLAGARVKMLGRRIVRRAARHLSGRIFATAVHLLTGLECYDSQCGLKIVRADLAARIMPHARATGFAFDVELLLLARRLGGSMEEFPVDWLDVSGSKVSVFRDAIPMLVETARAARHVEAIDDRTP